MYKKYNDERPTIRNTLWRIRREQIVPALRRMDDFACGRSITAWHAHDGNYYVMSYGTQVLVIDKDGVIAYFDGKFYSGTTAFLQDAVREAYPEVEYEWEREKPLRTFKDERGNEWMITASRASKKEGK